MSKLEPFDSVHAPLDGTTLIEASAGTGKTHTIATLFVRLLLEHGHSVWEILVVTYTRAATAELRQRIRKRLAQALEIFEQHPRAASGTQVFDAQLVELAKRSDARGSLQLDRHRLVEALRSFDQAAIFTIHGFCQRMLTVRAFESGIAFDMELIDNQRAWLQEAVNDHWARTLYDADELFVGYLQDQKLTPSKLLQLAQQTVGDPGLCIVPEATWQDVAPLLPRFEQSRARVAQLFLTDRREIRALLTRPGVLNAQTHPVEKIERVFLPPFERAASFRPGCMPDGVEKLGASTLALRTKKGQTPPRHAFFDACDELVAAAAEVEAALANNRLAFEHALVRYVREELPRRKDAEGVQSYDDLLLRLRAAIDGPRGDQLAQQIREAYPAALIDEFQDTDPTQCRIFARIYEAEAKAPGVLFLIGDPKQAIYGFRGADVFAYMEAARVTSTRAYTLDTNRRSDPTLVRAVNTLFGSVRAPFLLDDIGFQPVQPGPTARERLTGMPRDSGALEILFVPSERGAARKKTEQRDEQLPLAIAQEIVALLASGARIDAEPVEPKHIAVLCRTNREARLVQAALRERGVPAVLDGDSSVFDTDMADELERLLAALAEPGDGKLVRAALVSSLFALGADALLQLETDESEWERWLSRFHRWHDVWVSRGFIQALHAVLDDARVVARLLGVPGGERSLTDLLHLAELVHSEAMRGMHGPFALLVWYRRMRANEDARHEMAPLSAQIRMESDAHAVTLTTIHKSKGLEYPIVYAPFLWDGTQHARKQSYLRFHDHQHAGRMTLDLRGYKGSAIHAEQAVREELAENLRLLYVAVTRARHRLSIVWGAFKGGETAALGYLLHQPRSAHPQALAAETAARIKDLGDDEMRADLEALVQASAGAIAVRELSERDTRRHQSVYTQITLAARSSTRTLRTPVRASSFSRLAAGQHQPRSASVDDALERDQADVGLPPSAADDRPSQPNVLLAEFPSGPGPGLLLHSIYEQIDFRDRTPEALRPHVQRALVEHGADPGLCDTLCEAVSQTLRTPVDPEAGLPMLASLAPEDRLIELEFVFPVADGSDANASFSARALAAVLLRHARDDAEREYAGKVASLGFKPLRGYLRGFMDLVAHHAGRFYLLDYKSNHLGTAARDYESARLTTEMMRHHYVLQYLLYSVALHRHLSLRIADYSYEQHFGGVYYLFLRGMAEHHDRGTGVFRARPSRALISELSEVLRAPGAGT